MPLHIGPTEQGFHLEGELDLATSKDLLTAIRERPPHDEPLTLDFSDITFMDSSGLRALLEAAKGRGEDQLLVIVDPSPQVRRVLEISLPDGAPGLEVRAGEGGGT
jgi:anti-sigma B factor antagonist